MADQEKAYGLRQPGGFYSVFCLQMSQSLGFYLFYAILAVFYQSIFGFDQASASAQFGSFMAIGWGLTPAGGYLADKLLGARRAINVGAFLLAIGFLWDAVFVYLGFGGWLIYLGLACMITGYALFRVNPLKFLSHIYKKVPEASDSGYTIFYASVNIGSFLALVIGPLLLREDGGHYTRLSYAIIYFIAGLAQLCSLAISLIRTRLLKTTLGKDDGRKVGAVQKLYMLFGFAASIIIITFLLQHRHIANIVFYVIAAVAFFYYIYNMKGESSAMRKRMCLALVLMAQAVVFYILYAQMGTSMNFYAINNARDFFVGGWKVSPLVYQAFNPGWIIILSPILAWFYSSLAKKDKDLPIVYKFSIGMFFSVIAFGCLWLSRFFPDGAGKVDMLWFLFANLFQSTAELLISAIGLSMIVQYSPKRIAGLALGTWYLTLALANILGGWIASMTNITAKEGQALDPHQTLLQSTNLFFYIACAVLAVAVVMIILAPFLSKLAKAPLAAED